MTQASLHAQNGSAPVLIQNQYVQNQNSYGKLLTSVKIFIVTIWNRMKDSFNSIMNLFRKCFSSNVPPNPFFQISSPQNTSRQFEERATLQKGSFFRMERPTGPSSLSVSDQAKVDDILAHQRQTVNNMTFWVSSVDWDSLSGPKQHFDWWMFPIDRSSRGYGDRFTVNSQIVNRLKRDPVFMANYRKSVKWMMLSWGWDIEKCQPANNGRNWTQYTIRLAKIAQSLQLFGETQLLNNIKIFTQQNVPGSDLEPWMYRYLR